MGRSSDRVIVVCCAACRTVLTRSLRQAPGPDCVSHEDGADYLPAGHYLISDGSYYPAGQVVVNLADLVNTRPHPDGRRLNGCCGLDGCDGMNRVCANGHEVGTERSDCWWAHGLHFDPSRVVLEGQPGRPASADLA